MKYYNVKEASEGKECEHLKEYIEEMKKQIKLFKI